MTGYTEQTTKAKYSQIFDSTGAIRCCNMVSITGVFFEAKSDKKQAEGASVAEVTDLCSK